MFCNFPGVIFKSWQIFQFNAWTEETGAGLSPAGPSSGINFLPDDFLSRGSGYKVTPGCSRVFQNIRINNSFVLMDHMPENGF